LKDNDTIVAIGTALGIGGIAIVRISGAKAFQIVSKIFRTKAGAEIKEMKSHTLRYGFIHENDSKQDIDEVLITFMKGPKSFTAEDTIEINCHGGVVSAKLILEEVIKVGARLAEPGEFTKRAFINGRLDMSQAEAVIDIINAKTEVGLKAAVFQSEGHLSSKINILRDNILELIAHIEATVDYPEDDLEELTSVMVVKSLISIKKTIDKLLSYADEGKIVREGINTVIIGKPNVGKSSLLNLLLMEDRAIVSSIPGTTRDVIEESVSIDGIQLKITDTAGIRESEDEIEKIGVNISIKKIQEADLIVFVLDRSKEITKEDMFIFNYIQNMKYIVILNKSDLICEANIDFLKELLEENIIEVSVIEGYGVDKLKSRIKDIFFTGQFNSNELILTNSRHKEALIRTKECIDSAKEALRNTMAIDLASIDLKNAWNYLGQITGDTLEEDIIDKIFSKFCIGK